jgi:hypothetical protein
MLVTSLLSRDMSFAVGYLALIKTRKGVGFFPTKESRQL